MPGPDQGREPLFCQASTTRVQLLGALCNIRCVTNSTRICGPMRCPVRHPVLDLTPVLADPTCARTLAEHGADVLKITASQIAARDDQEYDTGHGKLSARLDLRQPQDLDTLKGLVREGDVFSQGYRPGTLAGRGLSPEELAALRPGLVYVSLCAFSHTGPWASRRGFDTVVQNVSGIAPRRAVPRPRARSAILPGVGDRLSDRLPDGVWRDGGIGATRPRRRRLDRSHLAGAD